MQAQQLLQQRFPGMEVAGSTYPVPASKQALAQALGLVQMAGFGFVVFGEKIFEALGYAAPPELFVQNVAGNKFGVGIGIWFVGNFLQNQLLSTGAFEVYYDGTLVGGWFCCAAVWASCGCWFAVGFGFSAAGQGECVRRRWYRYRVACLECASYCQRWAGNTGNRQTRPRKVHGVSKVVKVAERRS